MDARLQRGDPHRGRAGRCRRGLRLVRSRGELAHRRAARPDPGRRHDRRGARHPVRAEILADADDLDTYGGVIGLVFTLGLGVAGVVLYLAATRWWSGGPAAPWTTAIDSGGRATKLVLLGAALVLIGWLGNVTIGFWFLRAGTEVITLILLAALVMRAAADPDEPLRLPLPPAFAALALSVIGAIIAVQHTARFIDQGGGLDDWICQLLYVAGVVIVIVGAGLASAEGSRTLTEGPTGATPTA